ncbi:uncharacterized protein LOC131610451 isoform X2 [Vicia villosa]|uniref:uncharacterized protein LOC131610451 isoform X2 n=1 Tax=Vicia villosa TaxID=3911 RepID=UPI00273B6B27|nr:uncharacterized protein LOC131610451 isoform X2 [Vicia villosa]
MSAAAPFSPVSTTTTNVKTIFVRLLIQHLAIYDTSEMKRIRLVSAMEITLACGNYFSPPIKKMHVYFCWCLRYLEDVFALRQGIPFRRICRGVGRTTQAQSFQWARMLVYEVC